MLNVTDVRITKIEGDEKLRAFAAIVIDDCFLVGDLRVVEGEERYFVAMPRKRKRHGCYRHLSFPPSSKTPDDQDQKGMLAYEATTGNRAFSRIEAGEVPTVRPDLLSVEEFGFTPKLNP